jgi:hypothetical protein
MVLHRMHASCLLSSTIPVGGKEKLSRTTTFQFEQQCQGEVQNGGPLLFGNGSTEQTRDPHLHLDGIFLFSGIASGIAGFYVGLGIEKGLTRRPRSKRA